MNRNQITNFVKALMFIHTEEFKTTVLNSIPTAVTESKLHEGVSVSSGLEVNEVLRVECAYTYHNNKNRFNLFLYHNPWHSKLNINCDDFVVDSYESDGEILISNTKAELYYTRYLLNVDLSKETYSHYKVIDYLNNLVELLAGIGIDLDSVRIIDDVSIPEPIERIHKVDQELLQFIRSIHWAYFGDDIFWFTFNKPDTNIELLHISRYETGQYGYGHLEHTSPYRCIRHLKLDGMDFYIRPWKHIYKPLVDDDKHNSRITEIEVAKRHRIVDEFINSITEKQLDELKQIFKRMKKWIEDNPHHSFHLYDESKAI